MEKYEAHISFIGTNTNGVQILKQDTIIIDFYKQTVNNISKIKSILLEKNPNLIKINILSLNIIKVEEEENE